ncbi:MAG: MGMT family protein [Armatimonadota bacterium]
MTSLRERILAVARRIPSGSVATYGDVARLAGAPRAAREVGWALSSLPEGSDVPWWRVVNRLGEITCPSHASGLQAELLAEEGVPLTAEGRVDLARARWEPDEAESL